MVWFQCEDCGDELKKPKLPNHFRICSASKLSCIDCGVMFGQDTVQSHTQCITEAEKYGPKGQANKAQNGVTPKPDKDVKKHVDFDIYAGLSERPPWFCSLCNTKATSKQTLFLHADGKKHRAKARAFHAANQPPKQSEESANGGGNSLGETNAPDTVKADAANAKSETENGNLEKKRKHDDSESDANGKVGVGLKGEETESHLKKVKKSMVKDDEAIEADSMKDKSEKKKKWKKLIKSALKTNPDGVLKMKKLKKIVLKSLREYGSTEDESKLSNVLEQKINSSSRFRLEGKYVHLATKD